MAGTYAEQTTLAQDSQFINLCRAALIKRAFELDDGTDKQTLGTLNLVNGVMSDSAGYAQRMAWLVACGNPTIGAAAPVLPSQGDVQYAVNTYLPKLVR